MDNYKYLKVFYNDKLVGTLAKTPDRLVAFEYDTGKYMVTMYKADGVSADKNSDAVKATKNIDGNQKTAAYTDIINKYTKRADT